MESKDWAEDFVRRVMRWEFSGEHEDTRASDVRKLFADELRARVGASPDDSDMPVTVEWMQNILSLRMGYGFVVTPLLSIWRTTRHGWGLHYHGGEGDAFDSLPSLIAEAPTRGHVRRLLAALGITLPAAPKGESQ